MTLWGLCDWLPFGGHFDSLAGDGLGEESGHAEAGAVNNVDRLFVGPAEMIARLKKPIDDRDSRDDEIGAVLPFE